MVRFNLFIVSCMMISLPIFAQGYINTYVPHVPQQGSDPIKILDAIETMFIEDVFAGPIVDSQDLFVSDDDDFFVGGLAERQLIKDLLSKEFAKALSNQDVLGLKRQYYQTMQGLE